MVGHGFQQCHSECCVGNRLHRSKDGTKGPGEQLLQSSALYIMAAPTRVVAERLNVTHILKVELTRFTDEVSCVRER